MRSWFLSLLEILVVGKGLEVFITSSTGKNMTNLHTKKFEERYSMALP